MRAPKAGAFPCQTGKFLALLDLIARRLHRHLERELCNRCTQFIGAELETRAMRPWLSGGVTGSGFALAMLVAGLPGVTVVGLPLGIAAFFAHRVLQRRRLTRLMGPALAASKGELPPPGKDFERFPDSPPPRGTHLG